MDDPVGVAWERISAWCREHAPQSAARMLTAPSAADLARVAGMFPRGWPADLQRLYEVQGGSSDSYEWSVAPLFGLLPLPGIESSAVMLRGSWHTRDDLGRTGVDPEDAVAGTVSLAWPASYVPFADSGAGDVLFVDTRPGRHTGCVREFLEADADVGRIMWSSVTAMLTDIAGVMEGDRALREWVPSIADGVLVWDLRRRPG